MSAVDLAPGNPADADLAAVARALAHPARVRIVALLARTPGCIGGDIVEAVGLAQSTVSEHLRILKEAGVVMGEIAPPRVCYCLRPGAVAALAAFLQTLNTAAAPVEDPEGPRRRP